MTVVLIDTNVLIELLHPRPAADRKVRLDGLLREVQESRGQVLIPAQVIAEYLVQAGTAGEQILERLLSSRYVQVVTYDHRAAVETAAMHRAATAANGGHKRWPLGRETAWQKVNVDRQVVAFAKVHGVSTIVAEDGDVHRIASVSGVKCIRIRDLPVPESARQLRIEGVGDVPAIPALESARVATGKKQPRPEAAPGD